MNGVQGRASRNHSRSSGPGSCGDCSIDERHQRRGYGSEVVRQVAEIVRVEGATELLTSRVPGDGGQAGFYERLGFVPTGDLDVNDEVIVRLAMA